MGHGDNRLGSPMNRGSQTATRRARGLNQRARRIARNMRTEALESQVQWVAAKGDSAWPPVWYSSGSWRRVFPMNASTVGFVLRPAAPAMSNSILLVEDNEDNRIIYATALRY